METMQPVRTERDGAVARVVLDRPPLNVLDTAAMRALAGALAGVEADPSVKVVLLSGAGRAFCAGVDVADHAADRVGPMLAAFHEAIDRLMHLSRPVVAAVHGAALGGGCELLLACDVVIAGESAKLGLPEIRLGVFPPVAAALLPARVGPQAAADLILSGRTIGAAEAERIGLVGRVVPDEALEGAAREYAASMAALSGPVLRLAKRALAGREPGAEPAVERAEHIYRAELMQLRDAHEGIAAFVERREPVWKEA